MIKNVKFFWTGRQENMAIILSRTLQLLPAPFQAHSELLLHVTSSKSEHVTNFHRSYFC